MSIGDTIIVLSSGRVGVIDDITREGNLVCKFTSDDGQIMLKTYGPFALETRGPGL